MVSDCYTGWSDLCFLSFVFDIHAALCIEGVSFVLVSRVLSTMFTRLVGPMRDWLYKRDLRFLDSGLSQSALGLRWARSVYSWLHVSMEA